MPFKIRKFSDFQQFCDVMYKRTTIQDQSWWSWAIQRRKVWGLSFSNPFRMSSYHLLLSCSNLEKIWDIPEFHIRPYCHIWDCTSGLDSRMDVIESAFESSGTISFDHKKFSNIRTHPEELRAMKSKLYLRLYECNSIFYFWRRVVLRDEFLYCWIFYDRKIWCLSSQTHF